MSEREKWVDLVYKGKNFGDVFQISNQGHIRNIKTNYVYTNRKDGNVITCGISYKGDTYRIDVAKAQRQNGLEVSVIESPYKELKGFSINQVKSLEKLYGQRIDDLEERYMERMDRLEIKIHELTKELEDYKNG